MAWLTSAVSFRVDDMVASVTRSQVLGFRVRAQQLDRESGTLADTTVLDIGAQDTGPDGARWALSNRGVDVSRLSGDELVGVWTIRGAPHLYRRDDLMSVAAAVEPFSDADAGKRIYDATKPLKAAGISNLDALDAVAAALRSVVTKPMVKGEVSTAVAALMDLPYLRFCRSCNATHLYEMPFRLAGLRAGLELEAGTSPPVLRPIAGFKPGGARSKGGSSSKSHSSSKGRSNSKGSAGRYDVIRTYLRLLGPATPKHVADYLDAPVKDVKARWPSDAVEVSVEGESRWVLADDAERLEAEQVKVTRLLGPFDLFLQARDRTLLVDDPARAKALWPVLGRPGAVLVDGEIAGMWRPRKSGKSFRVQVDLCARASTAVRKAISEQAERLAAYRQITLSGIDLEG
jgi:Winged helix DNA-binding domain